MARIRRLAPRLRVRDHHVAKGVGLLWWQDESDILGGSGIMRDFPAEKIIRDILTFLHGDGTDSLTLLRIAQTLDDPA